MTKQTPPQLFLRFFRWFCHPKLRDAIEGDLMELYRERRTKGVKWKADMKFIIDVLLLFRPGIIKPVEGYKNLNNDGMIRSYFKIAWRNLIKKTGYSTINILGLGLGLASCFLIFMFVHDELSYDNYHEKGDRIHRVIHGRKSENNSNSAKANPFWVWGNAPIGPAIGREFPEIDKVVQFSGRSDILLSYGDKHYQEDGIFFMDSTVFDVFSWELVKGNPKTALAAPFSIVLTETTAKKYFGEEDPIGKSLKGSESAGRSNAGDYTVTGVMKDVPSNSHFRFNALLSMSTFKKSIPDIFDMWGYVDFYTYFLVNDKFDKAALEKKIPDFLSRIKADPDNKYTISIEPLKDVYLRTDAERQPGQTGSLSNIYIFSVIGVFILVIAIINFMNLSTARSMERAKEVGIRKSVGAYRSSLIFQFLGESFIIVLLSMIVAIFLVILAVPSLASLTGKVFVLQNIFNAQLVFVLLVALVLISAVAGSYPALVLSGFAPVTVLKGIARLNLGGVNLRRFLVIFQFSLSIALIAGTIIVYTQMNHLLDKDLGFDKERMLVLDYNYDELVNRKSQALKIEMEALPSVLSAAFSRSVPGSYFPNAGTGIQGPDGEMKWNGQAIFQVGMDFIPHFGLKLVAGRSYSRDFPSDSTKALVINEAAAKQYGYSNPADIVGKNFDQWGKKGQIIGVVKDFNYVSLHRTIEPLTLPLEPYASRYLTLKVKSENMAETIEEIGKIWSKLAPHRPFLYSFLDEDFNRQYQSDFIFRKLFTSFSFLAIFIACLGLLGLATYTAEQRTKEIGIRKVLGAGTGTIVALLSKDFIKLVLIAILVATPVAWYAMNQWLEGFAYKISISGWTFFVAGLASLCIAFVSIGFQTLKAAIANPVNSLRSE
jgi:putative ABC transport system permease protein